MNREYSSNVPTYNGQSYWKNKKKKKNSQFKRSSESNSYNQGSSQFLFDERGNLQQSNNNPHRVSNGKDFGYNYSKKQIKKNRNRSDMLHINSNFNHKTEWQDKRKHLNENPSTNILSKSEKHQQLMKVPNKNSKKANNSSNSDETFTDLIAQTDDSDLFYFDIMGNLNNTYSPQSTVFGKSSHTTVVDLVDSDLEISYQEKDNNIHKTSKKVDSNRKIQTPIKESVEAQLEKMFVSPKSIHCENVSSSLVKSIGSNNELLDDSVNSIKKKKLADHSHLENVSINKHSRTNSGNILDVSYNDIYNELNDLIKSKQNKSKECPNLELANNISGLFKENPDEKLDVSYIDIHNELNDLIASKKTKKKSKACPDVELVNADSHYGKNADGVDVLNINSNCPVNDSIKPRKKKKKLKTCTDLELLITDSHCNTNSDERVDGSKIDSVCSLNETEKSRKKKKKMKQDPDLNLASDSVCPLNDTEQSRKKKKKMKQETDLNLAGAGYDDRLNSAEILDIASNDNHNAVNEPIKPKKKKRKSKEGADLELKDIHCEFGQKPNEALDISYFDIITNELSESKSKKKKKKKYKPDLDLAGAGHDESENSTKILDISSIDSHNILNESIKSKKKKKKSKDFADLELTDIQCEYDQKPDETLDISYLDNTNELSDSKSKKKKKKMKHEPDLDLAGAGYEDSANSIKILDISSIDSHNTLNESIKSKKKKKNSKDFSDLELTDIQCEFGQKPNETLDISYPDIITNELSDSKSKKKKKKIKHKPDLDLVGAGYDDSENSTKILDISSIDNHNTLNESIKSKKKKKKSKECADLELTDIQCEFGQKPNETLDISYPDIITNELSDSKSKKKKKKMKHEPDLDLAGAGYDDSANSIKILDISSIDSHNILNESIKSKKKKKKSKDFADLELTDIQCEYDQKHDETLDISYPDIITNELSDSKSKKKKKKIKHVSDLDLAGAGYDDSANSIKILDISSIDSHNTLNESIKSKKKKKYSKDFSDLELRDIQCEYDQKPDEMLDISYPDIITNELSDSKSKKKKKIKHEPDLDLAGAGYDDSANSIKILDISSIDNHNTLNESIKFKKKKKKSEDFVDLELTDIQCEYDQKPDETLDISYLDNTNELSDSISKKKKIKHKPGLDLAGAGYDDSANSIKILDISPIDRQNTLNESIKSKKKKRKSKECANLELTGIQSEYSKKTGETLDTSYPNVSDEFNDSNKSKKNRNKSKKEPDFNLTCTGNYDNQNSDEVLDLLPYSHNIISDDLIKSKKKEKNVDLEISGTETQYSKNPNEMLNITHSEICEQLNGLIQSKKKKSSELKNLELLDTNSECKSPILFFDRTIKFKKKKAEIPEVDSQFSSPDQPNVTEPCTSKKRKKHSFDDTEFGVSEIGTQYSNSNSILIDPCTPKKKRKKDSELANAESQSSNTLADHLKEQKEKAKEVVHALKNSEDSNVLSDSSTPVKRKKIKESPLNEDIESISILFGVNPPQKETMEPIVNLDSSFNSPVSKKKQKRKLKLEPLHTNELISTNDSLGREDKNNLSVKDTTCKRNASYETDNESMCVLPNKEDEKMGYDGEVSSRIDVKGKKEQTKQKSINEYLNDRNLVPKNEVFNTSRVKPKLGYEVDIYFKTTTPDVKRKKKEHSQKLDSSSSSDIEDTPNDNVNSKRILKDRKLLYLSKFASIKSDKKIQTKLTDWVGKQKVSKIYLLNKNEVNESEVQINSSHGREDSQVFIKEENDSNSKNNKKKQKIEDSSDDDLDNNLRRSPRTSKRRPSYKEVDSNSEGEDYTSEDEDSKEKSCRKQGNKEEINESELVQLAGLKIQLPRVNIPVLHAISIPSTATAHELNVAKKHKAKIGRFSQAEDEVIKKNWETLCKSHNLTVRPSAMFTLPRIMSRTEQIKFLQYLSTGLDNRIPIRIFQRFKKIFQQNVKRGRYSAKEDMQILEFMSKTMSWRPYKDLGILLNRTTKSVEDRARTLLEGAKNVRWDIVMAERLIKALLEATGKQKVEDLEQIALTPEQWKKVSSLLDNIPVPKIRAGWKITVHPKLFETEDTVTVKKDLVRLMIANNETDIKAINWEKYAEHFEGMTGRRLNYLFNQLRFYASASKMEGLPATLKHISEVYQGYQKRKNYKLVYKNGKLMKKQ